MCFWVREFLDVSFEPQMSRFRLHWKYVKVDITVQQALFRTNPRKSRLVPCWILWFWQRMFLLVDATTSLSVCRLMKRLNQSLPAASLAAENGWRILFWTANWEASLLTSSRVHPKYFLSVAERYSTCFFSRAGGIIGLRPQFWLGGLKRVRIWANVIASWRTRHVIFLISCKMSNLFVTYRLHCLYHVFLFPWFYLLTSGRSNVPSVSTLTSSCYWKEKIIVQNFKWCVIHSHTVSGCNLFPFQGIHRESDRGQTSKTMLSE